MGCLAALSLAGCGDSGGGSSTVPSERLISEGYCLILRSDESGDKVSYLCWLFSNGKCLFYPHEEDTGFSFNGSWTETFLGGGKFRITFSGFSKVGDSLYCEITFTPGPIILTIHDMRAYRAAQAPVDGSFDKAPFTHGADCPGNANAAAGTGLKLRMVDTEI